MLKQKQFDRRQFIKHFPVLNMVKMGIYMSFQLEVFMLEKFLLYIFLKKPARRNPRHNDGNYNFVVIS